MIAGTDLLGSPNCFGEMPSLAEASYRNLLN